MVPASTTAMSTVSPESSLLSKVILFLSKTHGYLHIIAAVARMPTRDIGCTPRCLRANARKGCIGIDQAMGILIERELR
jgi:hypothetical protein